MHGVFQDPTFSHLQSPPSPYPAPPLPLPHSIFPPKIHPCPQTKQPNCMWRHHRSKRSIKPHRKSAEIKATTSKWTKKKREWENQKKKPKRTRSGPTLWQNIDPPPLALSDSVSVWLSVCVRQSVPLSVCSLWLVVGVYSWNNWLGVCVGARPWIFRNIGWLPLRGYLL